MADGEPELTLDDVEQVLRIVDSGEFDYVDMDINGLKLTARFGAGLDESADRSRTERRSPEPLQGSRDGESATDGVRTADLMRSEDVPVGTAAPAAAAEQGTGLVTAPVGGVFYRSPAPGAAPFVEVGDAVSAGDTVGLIELMKLFSAVIVDQPGVVEEVLVADARPVSRGEGILRVRPV